MAVDGWALQSGNSAAKSDSIACIEACMGGARLAHSIIDRDE